MERELSGMDGDENEKGEREDDEEDGQIKPLLSIEDNEGSQRRSAQLRLKAVKRHLAQQMVKE